jgi:thiol-disulfide isomerase/thioredoxin
MYLVARIAVVALLVVSVASFVLISPDAAAQSGEKGIELKSVKYADLVQAIRAQRGKVIVVDLWGDFCIPCKREFHNLVELNQQYGDKGLVCMSVALDPPEGKEGALKFLTKSKATFANYWLDEKAAFWQERWGIKGPPAVFVFDRQGRRAAKFDSEDPEKPLSYEDVKKLVPKLLAPPS